MSIVYSPNAGIISTNNNGNVFLIHSIFEEIAKYCATYSNLIPLSFVLGFYVSIVMTRWWNQYVSIPWPDTFAVFVSANIHGQVMEPLMHLLSICQRFSFSFLLSCSDTKLHLS